MSDRLRILGERRITLDEARAHLGSDGRPIHFVTAWRAATRGVAAPNGERVYLETLKMGGRLVTSVEAVERFIARTNGISQEDVESSPETVSGKARAKELARVDAELAAARL
jgi:hypothetical protein